MLCYVICLVSLVLLYIVFYHMDEHLSIYIIKNLSHIHLNIDFNYLLSGGILYHIYTKVS